MIDCFRNPYEPIYLRNEFAGFFLLSLYEHKEKRRERYLARAKQRWGARYSESSANKIFEEADRRDSGGNVEGAAEVLYKQNVTRCVQMSDVAINNFTQEDPGSQYYVLYRKVLRIVCLILNPGCTKPRKDEMFMNLAYAVATKSNCISRQVGAVIVGREGYVIGVGWNDVAHGQRSCGLMTIGDLETTSTLRPLVDAIAKPGENMTNVVNELLSPYRNGTPDCEPRSFCFCFKDQMAKRDAIPRLTKAWKQKLKQVVDRSGEAPWANDLDAQMTQFITELVNDGHLHQLEYCRALHAEENAILQSAKIGGTGLTGATIYTTALPCTLCAKMIQQVGIKTVVFTEPYPKALTGIYMRLNPVQFEGVKPRAYIRLFLPNQDQKEWQELRSLGLIPDGVQGASPQNTK